MSSFPPPAANFFTTFPTRRSYGCYNCNNSFLITPVTADTSSSPLPTSFRCPHCFQRHLIPNYTVVPPPPPTPPPVLNALSVFTYNNSQDDDEENEDEEEEEEEEEDEIGYEFAYAFLNNNYNNNYISQPPSINSFLSSLPVKELDPNTNNKSVCSICMEEFGRKTVVELPCGHFFDKDCIAEWIKRSKTCPMCRFKLPLGGGNKVGMRRGVNEYNALINRIVREAREPPVLRRVNAESSLSAVADEEAAGADRRVLSTNGGGERSRQGEATRDGDGDTMMEDAA